MNTELSSVDVAIVVVYVLGTTLLDHVTPDRVHVLARGRIVKSGDKSLALELEAKGYDWVKQELAHA